MAEVGRFGPLRVAVNQFGVAGENQQRREARGNDIGLPHAIVLQMEFVELACQGQRNHADTEVELRCMVFSQILALRVTNAK